jgi:hypothetical protein
MGGKTSDSIWTDVTTAVAIASILGFSGFVYSSVDSIRKDRLDDAKSQIGDLYGPLCALISVHTSIWNQFLRKTGEAERTSGIETLLEPLDKAMHDKILGSGVSIVDADIRVSVQKFLLHDASTQIKGTDNSAEDVPFPVELGTQIERKLTDLHRRQSFYGNPFLGLNLWKTFDSNAKPRTGDGADAIDCTGKGLMKPAAAPAANP